MTPFNAEQSACLLTNEHARPVLIERVSSIVRAGGIVMLPTDTVYGIVCDPLNQAAIARIFALKGRDEGKPLGILCPDITHALAMCDAESERTAIEHFLPGPLTLLVSRRADSYRAAAKDSRLLALRVVDDSLLSDILAVTGPLASTSANASGDPAFTGANIHTLTGVDLFIDSGPTRYQRESTIIDVTGPVAKIVRQGALDAAVVDAWNRRGDEPITANTR